MTNCSPDYEGVVQDDNFLAKIFLLGCEKAEDRVIYRNLRLFKMC